MVQAAVRFPTRVYLFYSRFRRAMTLGVRAAVFDRDDRVFLVRHSYVRGWYMPGGGVEPGEALQEALSRELSEEGGIALTGPPRLFSVYWNARASPRDHVALYVCREWQQAHAAAAEHGNRRQRFLPARCAAGGDHRRDPPPPRRDRRRSRTDGGVVVARRR